MGWSKEQLERAQKKRIEKFRKVYGVYARPGREIGDVELSPSDADKLLKLLTDLSKKDRLIAYLSKAIEESGILKT